MRGPVADHDLISGDHGAGRHDPEVGAGGAAATEALDPARFVVAELGHVAGEGATGDPGRAHRQDEPISDVPSLADDCSGEVESGNSEVLPKASRRQGGPECRRPPGEILLGVGVDRLVGAAVAAAIADDVPGETALATLRPRVDHCNRTEDGALVDSAPIPPA